MKRITTLLAVGACIIGLGACGSDDKKSDDTGDTTTTEAVEQTTPTLPPTTTTTTPPSPYKATGTPVDDVKAGDTVTVSVSDFKAGLTLGINLCASKDGAVADAPDCALDKIATLKVGADGTGSGTIVLIDKKVGTAEHDCHDATTRCFLSVGELSADPKAQRADDIDLHFAAS